MSEIFEGNAPLALNKALIFIHAVAFVEDGILKKTQ